MKRSAPLRRGKPLSRTPLRPKKRSAAERAEKFAREYGSKERVEWISWRGCLVCGHAPSDNAHTWNRGKGLKGPPESIVPLCRPHHRESHDIGVQSFEARYSGALCGRTLKDWAGTYAGAWQKWTGLTPLSAIVPGVVASLLDRAKESA